MTFGITPEGFVGKRLDDIKKELEDLFKASFGANIDLDADAPFGQLIGIFSEKHLEVWELFEAGYYSQYPETAEDVTLDNVVSITGITRKPATFSKLIATLTGSNGTVIPQGSIASVNGNPNSRFVTDVEVIIPISGTIDVAMTSESSGVTSAPSGSLTVIETAISGWDAITNALDAILGEAIETGADLKQRRNESLQVAGAGTVSAIRSNLLSITDVTAVVVFENTDILEDANGLPPKSFEAIVENGLDAEIAQSILDTKPAGIQTHGSLSEIVEDSQGFDQTIKFSRPTPIDIHIELDISTDPDKYPVTGDQLVEDAILAHGLSLGIGEDVIVTPALICALNDIEGITDIIVRIGFAVSPTLDDNLAIAPNEISAWDSSRVTVVST